MTIILIRIVSKIPRPSQCQFQEEFEFCFYKWLECRQLISQLAQYQKVYPYWSDPKFIRGLGNHSSSYFTIRHLKLLVCEELQSQDKIHVLIHRLFLLQRHEWEQLRIHLA